MKAAHCSDLTAFNIRDLESGLADASQKRGPERRQTSVYGDQEQQQDSSYRMGRAHSQSRTSPAAAPIGASPKYTSLDHRCSISLRTYRLVAVAVLDNGAWNDPRNYLSIA